MSLTYNNEPVYVLNSEDVFIRVLLHPETSLGCGEVLVYALNSFRSRIKPFLLTVHLLNESSQEDIADKKGKNPRKANYEVKVRAVNFYVIKREQ